MKSVATFLKLWNRKDPSVVSTAQNLDPPLFVSITKLLPAPSKDPFHSKLARPSAVVSTLTLLAFLVLVENSFGLIVIGSEIRIESFCFMPMRTNLAWLLFGYDSLKVPKSPPASVSNS